MILELELPFLNGEKNTDQPHLQSETGLPRQSKEIPTLNIVKNVDQHHHHIETQLHQLCRKMILQDTSGLPSLSI